MNCDRSGISPTVFQCFLLTPFFTKKTWPCCCKDNLPESIQPSSHPLSSDFLKCLENIGYACMMKRNTLARRGRRYCVRRLAITTQKRSKYDGIHEVTHTHPIATGSRSLRNQYPTANTFIRHTTLLAQIHVCIQTRWKPARQDGETRSTHAERRISRRSQLQAK